MRTKIGMILAGGCAGLVAGLFGAGGGLVLVPLLTLLTDVDEEDLFALLDEEDAEALRDKFSGDDKDEIETVITPFVPSPIPTEVPEVVVKENDSKGVLIGSIFCVAVVGALAAVIFIIMRKKKAEEEKPDPDADYHDEDDEYYADDHEEGYDSRESYDEDDE